MPTWKDRERTMPNITPDLFRVNELIAHGLNGREIAIYFKEKKHNTWLKRFNEKYKIPFTYYKKEILKRLKNETY
jgi:hypothetical protein